MSHSKTIASSDSKDTMETRLFRVMISSGRVSKVGVQYIDSLLGRDWRKKFNSPHFILRHDVSVLLSDRSRYLYYRVMLDSVSRRPKALCFKEVDINGIARQDGRIMRFPTDYYGIVWTLYNLE